MNQGTKLILPMALLASSVAFAQETDERVTALENEVALLKSANQSSALDRLKFNGFYSFGVTRSNNDAGYAESESSYSFDELTLIGLQGEFALADSTSVVAQILAKGVDDFDMSMEWAYIKHTFDNDITARAGKLRVPLFMYSDFLDVGFAQPWVRPPSETYSQVPFNSYVGADIAYDIEFSESVISLQAFGGEAMSIVEREVNGANLEFESEFGYMWGTSVAWNYDSLTLRGVYGQTVANSNDVIYGQITDNSKATFVGAGLQYDNGELLVISEFTSTEIEGEYPDVDSYYATIGYRFGHFMPYFNYGYAESTDNSDREGKFVSIDGTQAGLVPSGMLFDGQRSAYSVGLRYELLSNLAIKADVTYVNNLDGTAGFMTGNAGGAEEDTMVYSIRLDGVF